MNITFSSIKIALILLSLFFLCSLIYFPGLSGGFLFDDLANFPALGQYGLIDNLEIFKLYITSGIAGPTGRPISLLSFLIDAQNWPADPWLFKRTNLVFHLLNGLILFFLCLKTLQLANYRQKQSVQIALLACFMWLLHPFFVSTVLYPVQRMSQLSALFVMLGLLLYIILRSRFLQQPSTKRLLALSLGIPFFIVLATFSKENGALLPLLIFLYEFIIFKHTGNKNLKNKTFFYWYSLFITLPSFLLVAYFSYSIFNSVLYNHARHFSFYERILTEGRVLIHYLYQLFIPHSATNGIYNDELAKSTSLFSPITTFLSWFAIISMIFFALKLRKKQPLFSLSILFFFTAHLMESGVIMLELYFEHRNYLPAIFLFLPFAALLIGNKILNSRSKVAIIIVIVIVMSSLTGLRTMLWGNPTQQTIAWSQTNPSSARTQIYLVLELQNNNYYPEAEMVLVEARQENPGSFMLIANLFLNRCTQNKLTQKDIDMLTHGILTRKAPGKVTYETMNKIIDGECSDLKLSDIEKIISDILANGNIKHKLKEIMFNLYGHLSLKQKNADKALLYYKKSLLLSPDYNKVLSLSTTLASQEYYTQALVLIDYFSTLTLVKPHKFKEKVHAYFTDAYYEKELSRIRLLVVEDLKQNTSVNIKNETR